jgi:2-amino-4-hydroxy-6-hydroxymethyldihydropteridine diphosphokinase
MRAAATRWCPAYVGIGSNLDSPEKQVLAAITALGTLPDTVVTRVSSSYRSEPMGPVRQADFVNAVAAMLTVLAPHKLLAELRAIEDVQGRKRDGESWGPRTIDLDLLVFGNEEIDDDTLTVPHPGIRARNFVLLPLCELAPHLIVPGVGTVAALTSAVSTSGGRIEKISESSK